jgi:hypothetical protein
MAVSLPSNPTEWKAALNFLPSNTLDFVFSEQRSGSAQTPLSHAVPARRQHEQVDDIKVAFI